jgi:hypothetical protein
MLVLAVLVKRKVAQLFLQVFKQLAAVQVQTERLAIKAAVQLVVAAVAVVGL